MDTAWEVFKHYWWILLILAIAIFLVMNYKRNMNYLKKEKEKADARSARVKVGSKVILDSGMHGIVRGISDKTLTIEIAPKTLVEFERYGVIFVNDEEPKQ